MFVTKICELSKKGITFLIRAMLIFIIPTLMVAATTPSPRADAKNLGSNLMTTDQSSTGE